MNKQNKVQKMYIKCLKLNLVAIATNKNEQWKEQHIMYMLFFIYAYSMPANNCDVKRE